MRQATRAPDDRPPVTSGSPARAPSRSSATTAVHAASSCAAGAGERRPATRYGCSTSATEKPGRRGRARRGNEIRRVDAAARAVTEDERAAGTFGQPQMRARGAVRCCDFENVGHGSHSLPQPELSSKRGDETFCTLAPPVRLAARRSRADHGDRAGRRCSFPSGRRSKTRSRPTKGRRSSPTRTSTTCSRADRTKIDALLDRFIPAAVERRSAKTAWALAGPELRAYSSVAQWRAGNSPVPRYPARGTKFHYWTVVYVGKNEVLFNILLHPRPEVIVPVVRVLGPGDPPRDRTGASTASTRSRRSAIRARSGRRSSARTTSPRRRAARARRRSTHASRRWYAIPLFVVFGGVLLFPLSLGIAALVRGRRFRRATARP